MDVKLWPGTCWLCCLDPKTLFINFIYIKCKCWVYHVGISASRLKWAKTQQNKQYPDWMAPSQDPVLLHCTDTILRSIFKFSDPPLQMTGNLPSSYDLVWLSGSQKVTPTQRGCTESPWQTVESSCTCDPENLHPPVQVYLPEQPPLRCIHWCWETDSHGKIIFYISVDTMSMFKLNKTCNVLNTGSNSRLYDVMIINMELHQQMEHYRKRMWNARLRTRGRSFIDC